MWLSGKPLNVPVHQLVMGRHYQNHPEKCRILGQTLQFQPNPVDLSHR
jgi:hypothetical protein